MAEAQAGFDALEFPVTPRGFSFTGVQSVTGDLVPITFSYSVSGGELSLAQGLGDFPVYNEWSAVPLDEVQAVQVSGNPGEWGSAGSNWRKWAIHIRSSGSTERN